MFFRKNKIREERKKMDIQKSHYNCPKGLMDGYKRIKLDEYCGWQKCFKGFGGCPVIARRAEIDIKKIIKEIKALIKKKPDVKISLDSPNFFDIPSGAGGTSKHSELLGAIVNGGIKGYFCIETTVLSLAEKGKDFFRLLKKAGIQEVWLGVESGSSELRNKYNKPPFTNQQLETVIAGLKRAGIACCWYLVVSAEDTEQTIKQTVDLVKEAKPDRIFLFQAVRYLPGEQLINLDILEAKISEMKKHQNALCDLAEEIERKDKIGEERKEG